MFWTFTLREAEVEQVCTF